MKALKVIGVLLLIVIAAAVVIGLMGPKEYRVERTTEIDAPKEVVYKHVKYFENWENWSPWKEKDPKMEITVEGDGALGAVYAWKGDEKISGSGSMTATGFKENEEFTFDLDFFTPMEGHSKGSVVLEEIEEGKVKATWAFFGENDFIGRIFSVFYDMDAALGPDFERGLELLKNISEAEEVAEPYEPKVKIEEVTFEKTTYLMKKIDNVSWEQVSSSDFFAEHFGSLMEYVGTAGIQPVGTPATIYYTWDTTNKVTNVGIAIPVAESATGNGDFVIETIEESPATVGDYWGDYKDLGIAHDRIMDHQISNGIQHEGSVIEEYITDPQSESDPMKWNTRVVYLHK